MHPFSKSYIQKQKHQSLYHIHKLITFEGKINTIFLFEGGGRECGAENLHNLTEIF